jgi:hypothetical protein
MTRLDCRICGNCITQLLPGESIAQRQILLRISMTIPMDIGLKLLLPRMVALRLSTRETVSRKRIRNSWNGFAAPRHKSIALEFELSPGGLLLDPSMRSGPSWATLSTLSRPFDRLPRHAGQALRDLDLNRRFSRTTHLMRAKRPFIAKGKRAPQRVPSFSWNYRLEVQLSRHLHYTGWKAAVGLIDKSELPIVKSGIGICKSHAVKCVVHFPTKLETKSFAKREILAK